MATKGLSDKPGKQRASAAATPAASKPLNRSLHAAKAAKQDEFYTQYVDNQKEVEACLEFDADKFKWGAFKGNVVYCNCDDLFESNFNKLGLKRLICISYHGSPLAGQMTVFDEYNGGENGVNGHRKKPKAIAVIVDAG